MPELNFVSLDTEFELGRNIDVAKDEGGSLVIQTYSIDGNCTNRLWLRHFMAEKLRDWLIENYPISTGETK